MKKRCSNCFYYNLRYECLYPQEKEIIIMTTPDGRCQKWVLDQDTFEELRRKNK